MSLTDQQLGALAKAEANATVYAGPVRELELHKIKRSMHRDVIHTFWIMLRECETKANDDDDKLLKHQVEAWYRQWNRMTGDNKKPVWNLG